MPTHDGCAQIMHYFAPYPLPVAHKDVHAALVQPLCIALRQSVPYVQKLAFAVLARVLFGFFPKELYRARSTGRRISLCSSTRRILCFSSLVPCSSRAILLLPVATPGGPLRFPAAPYLLSVLACVCPPLAVAIIESNPPHYLFSTRDVRAS